MLIFSKKSDLIYNISEFRQRNYQSVGFVPTMGFLHDGHGSLIKKSLQENGLTICDIFVNPLQFNEKSDFENYPVDIERDIRYLESIGCDILYLPEHEDIYPQGHVPRRYDFGHLETVMEGKHRPGHFQGVAEVVRILFEIVQPDKAYFGEKDFQQLKIIAALIKQLQMPIELISCPIVREPDGLAMSSRNARLTSDERKEASFIYKQLLFCKEHFHEYTPSELQGLIIENFRKHPLFVLEYIEFADRETLQEISDWHDATHAGAFIAARLGNVRLIDNMLLF